MTDRQGFRFTAGLLKTEKGVLDLAEVLGFPKVSWTLAITGSYNARIELADKIAGLSGSDSIELHEAIFDGGAYGGMRFSQGGAEETRVLPLHAMTADGIELVAKCTKLWTTVTKDKRKTPATIAHHRLLANIQKIIDTVEAYPNGPLRNIRSLVFQTDSTKDDGQEVIPGLGRYRMALVSSHMPMIKGSQAWKDIGFRTYNNAA